MKVTCLQENLARGLGIVGRAVAVRSPLPITSNVLIATEHGRIKLSATNLDIALSCWIGGQIEEEGAITVPARLLSDFVNSLPNDRISTLAPRSRQVKLVCARNEASIGGLDADDFPPSRSSRTASRGDRRRRRCARRSRRSSSPPPPTTLAPC